MWSRSWNLILLCCGLSRWRTAPSCKMKLQRTRCDVRRGSPKGRPLRTIPWGWRRTAWLRARNLRRCFAGGDSGNDAILLFCYGLGDFDVRGKDVAAVSDAEKGEGSHCALSTWSRETTWIRRTLRNSCTVLSLRDTMEKRSEWAEINVHNMRTVADVRAFRQFSCRRNLISDSKRGVALFTKEERCGAVGVSLMSRTRWTTFLRESTRIAQDIVRNMSRFHAQICNNITSSKHQRTRVQVYAVVQKYCTTSPRDWVPLDRHL